MKDKHLQHLYHRAGFNIGPHKLNQLRNKTRQEVVNKLFFESKAFSPIKMDLSEFAPLLQNLKNKDQMMSKGDLRELRKKSRKKVRDLNITWLDRLVNSEAVLREKMTLFWANVFVCKDSNIWHIQQYNNMLRKHALGNFGSFVKAMAREPSMSKYLNNRQNVKESPNENFARELMELFTLGAGNYTEKDIQEAARAFTGWTFRLDGTYRLNKKKHDFGPKVFFGKKGNFNGTEIIDIILEQKQCARFICDKVYRYFVNPVINMEHLDEITDVFYDGYDIERLMRHIFNADWFYDSGNIGVKIKSPIELLVGIRKVVPLTFHKDKQVHYLQKMMGQILLYPVNVAGWKGNTHWIDSNTLMFRLKLPSVLLNNAVINLEEKGEFEDSFETYYKKRKGSKRTLQVDRNWDFFEQEYGAISPDELKKLLVLSPIDKDTDAFLSNLKITNNKDFCIQLMSIPEYQLC